MRPTARPISKLFFLSLLSFCLVACATGEAPPKVGKSLRRSNGTKMFFAPFDSVWRAAQVALKYPIAINNMDNGVLETDFIKADDGFQAPGDGRIPSSGVRYKISMILSKGKVEGRDGVRVTIRKIIEKKRDFFADPESLNSDGLEELVLLYRIDRELAVDDALRKAGGGGAIPVN